MPTEDPRLKNRTVVVYLGTLARTRNIDVLVHAIALVREQIPDVMLVLVGDADDADQRVHIKDVIQRPAVRDWIVHTGWIPMEEAWRYVRAADVAVSPFPRGPLLDGAGCVQQSGVRVGADQSHRRVVAE